MIHDVTEMSAGIVDNEGKKRIIVISFDRRISTDIVADFARRSVADLIKDPETKQPIERQLPRRWSATDYMKEKPRNEREAACAIASRGLDQCDTDPDSDHVVLCRQYGRAIDKIYRLSKILDGILAENDERNSPIRGYTIEDLNRETADRWPAPPEENE